jgi:O-antigen/teichoic acid export membrane protein
MASKASGQAVKLRLSPYAISSWLPDGSTRRGLAANSLGVMAMRIGSMGLGFVSTVILARYLGASGYGIYAWALAWATVLQLIATLGLDTLTIREIAAQKTQATWSAIRGLLRSGPLIVLCSSLTVAAGVIAAGLAFVSPAQQTTFVIAVAMVPVLALTNVREGAMQGLGRVIPSRLPEDLFRPSIFIALLAIGWSVLSLSRSAPTAMALQGIATLLAFFAGLLLLRWVLPAQLSSAAVSHLQVMPWIRQALPFVVLRAINTLLSQIDVILVGLLRGSTQVALYATATRVAALVGIAEFAVNAAYLPVISRLFVESGVDRLRTGAPLIALAGVLLSALLAIPLIVFAPFVMHYFGKSFSGGVFALRVLSVSFVISAISGLNIALLNMTRHVRAVMIGSGVGLATNVALNLILIPQSGARGAAIAWLLSILVWNGILELQVRRTLGISATPLALIPIGVRKISAALRSG